MNKALFKIFTFMLVLTGLMMTSCSDDDGESKILVKFNATPLVEGTVSIEKLAGLKVEFKETTRQDITNAELDESGTAIVELYKGTYDISVDGTIENDDEEEIVVSVKMLGTSILEDQQNIEGKVNTLPKKALGQDFIFSEIFFNGETNSGRMMHPDQYIVIFNPTEKKLYADGLCISVTRCASAGDEPIWYNKYYPNRIPILGFITIPGSGKEHAVAPGEKLVIAFNAADHSKVEGWENAVDLSGADYEIYWGPESKDMDNPDVDNVIHTFLDGTAFFFHPRGFWSPVMFRLENGNEDTIKKFIDANTTKDKEEQYNRETKEYEIVDVNITYIAADKIIDGVITGHEPGGGIVTATLPQNIDRGNFKVEGCHRQQLAIRKEIKVGSKIFYQDTNNSTDDFIRRKGQTAYPKGWRNK